MSPPEVPNLRTSPSPIVVGTLVMVMNVMPIFLAGAFSVDMREELDFSLAQLGLALATFRATGSLAARPLGSAADRLSSRSAILLALATVAASSVATALFVQGVLGLAICLAVAGSAAVMGQLAAIVLLTRNLDQQRQGFGLAVQVSALPIAAALSGVMLPLAGGDNWRIAYAVHAAMALGLAAAVAPRLGHAVVDRAAPTEGPLDRLPLAVQTSLAVMLGLGMVAATPLAIFIVETGRRAGLDPTAAGVLLLAGSAVSVTVRLLAGWAADRGRLSPLPAAATMLLLGAAGYGMLSFGHPVGVVFGALIAFGLGWGFVGLLFLAAVRLHPLGSGAASGALLPGGLIGGMGGPPLFGAIADWSSLGWAWGMSALAALLAACTGLLSLHLTVRAKDSLRN